MPRRPPPRGRGTAAEDQQVDLLALFQLEPDPERPRELAVARAPQLAAAGEPHQRHLLGLEHVAATSSSVFASRTAAAAGARTRPAAASRGESARADDLDPDPLARLQRFAALDEGGEEQVGERGVLEQQLAQHFAIDGDVADRLGHFRGQEDGLPESRFISPRKPVAPWRTISWPAESRIVISPSRIATNG